MFIDYAKIYVKSGKGGDGHVSFRRELYVPNGGPDGGNGGDGGSVILKVDTSENTLLPFKHKVKYVAENGEDGYKKRQKGKNGEDLIIKVPNGTIVRDQSTNKIIIDMTGEGFEYVLLKGGRGGLGNMNFATSRMQAPRYAKPGEPAKELNLILELKVLADVGLVGFPNVGKSSIISTLTNARPEINNYHFTTINPHLGVMEYNDMNLVIADIPGIIEGASDGKGLGLKFLKHIERTKILCHVVDISGIEGRDPLNDLDIIFKELDKYNEFLKNKKQIIIANKTDLLDEENIRINIENIKKKYKNIPIFTFSAITKIGLNELKNGLYDIYKNQIKNSNDFKFESEIEVNDLINVNNDEININKITEGKYEISGELVNKMLGYTNLDTEKGFTHFQKFFYEYGIIDRLKKMGLKEGDTVKVNNIEYEFYE